MYVYYEAKDSLEEINITFDSLDQVSDKIFTGLRTGKYYRIVGKFVGYDGIEYVALINNGMFADKSFLKFNNFLKNYAINVRKDQSFNPDDVM